MSASAFHFYTGDRDYLSFGGIWVRQIDPLRFHFLRLDNMNEACGQDNEGLPTYHVYLGEVDLSTVPAQEIASALRCMGIEDEETARALSLESVAGCVFEYGLYAPLHEVSSNNAHKAIRECKAESRRLGADADAYEAAMGRPVNRLGSTAREYARGDMTSAVVRGCAAGDRDAALVAKMYVATEGNTLGGRLEKDELARLREAVSKA